MTQRIVYLLARGVLRAMARPRVTRLSDTSIHKRMKWEGQRHLAVGGRITWAL